MEKLKEEITDKLETLIILALNADNISHEARATGRKQKRDGFKLSEEILDQGSLLGFKPMFPVSAYTFDSVGADREYATSPDYLMNHPAHILEDESEVMMLSGNMLKWFGFRKTGKRPKGVCFLGKPVVFYELHTRYIYPDGTCDYAKRCIPFDSKGNPMLATIDGHVVCEPRLEGVSAILSASLIEDSLRSGTMLARVKDATEIKFSVPLDDYKQVFATREGPMIGARRKSILHWVSKHLRESSKGKQSEVKKHLRGVQEFNMDGLRISIEPNDESMEDIAKRIK